jgi:hypothetical protein
VTRGRGSGRPPGPVIRVLAAPPPPLPVHGKQQPEPTLPLFARSSSRSCRALVLRRVRRQAVAGHHAVVVEPQQLDHVADVGLILDSARGRPRLSGEDRGCTTRPCLRRSAQTCFGKKKWAASSPCRCPISRRPTLKANSPRRPAPAFTPGQEASSSVIRSLAVFDSVTDGSRRSETWSNNDASSRAVSPVPARSRRTANAPNRLALGHVVA